MVRQVLDRIVHGKTMRRLCTHTRREEMDLGCGAQDRHVVVPVEWESPGPARARYSYSPCLSVNLQIMVTICGDLSSLGVVELRWLCVRC
jgi:hypothetical protein